MKDIIFPMHFWGLPTWCSDKESANQCRRGKRRGFDL